MQRRMRMYADNQKISGLQVKRQWILSYIGPICLWAPACARGWEGLAALLAAFVLWVVWLFFLRRQAQIWRSPVCFWGKFLSKALALFFQSYLVLTAVWIGARMTDLASAYLIPGVFRPALLALFVAVSAAPGSGKETRGRLAQAGWAWLRLGFVFLLFCVLFSCAREWSGANGFDWKGFAAQASYAAEGWSFARIGRGTVWLLGMLCGSFFAVWAAGDGCRPFRRESEFFRIPLLIGGLTALVMLLLWLGYGSAGNLEPEEIFLNLMAGVRVPGDFLRRLDLPALSLLFLAVWFTQSGLFFYCGEVRKRMNFGCARPVCILAAFLAGLIAQLHKTGVAWYPDCVKYFYLPVFAVLPFAAEIVRKRTWMRAAAVCLPLVLSLLVGCGRVEPERRAYPLALGISREEGEYAVYLQLAALTGETGQEKESSGEASSGMTLALRGRDAEEIGELYEQTQMDALDLGHLKAVIFQTDLLGDAEEMEKILNALEKEPIIGNSAFVFAADSMAEVMETAVSGAAAGSLGDFLSGYYENRADPVEAVTLKRVFGMRAAGEYGQLLLVRADGEGLSIEPQGKK